MNIFRIVLLTLILTSCGPITYERRVVCDNEFETPWSSHVTITDGGTIRWVDEWDEWAVYKIPGGVQCTREKQLVQ